MNGKLTYHWPSEPPAYVHWCPRDGHVWVQDLWHTATDVRWPWRCTVCGAIETHVGQKGYDDGQD